MPAMERGLLFRVIVLFLIIWIVATVISPQYDLPNTVLRAGKSAAHVAFDLLITAAMVLGCAQFCSPACGWTLLIAPSSVRLLELNCARLC